MTTYALVNPVFGLAGTATYKVYTYDSGGLVAANTWSDNGSTLNANPVVLDSNGMKKIYVETGKNYRFIYKTAADVTIIDVDPVGVADPAAGSSGSSTVANLTVTNNLTVENDLTVEGDTILNGDVDISGDLTIIGDTISNGIKLTSLAPGFRNGTIDAAAAANAITFTYETMASATPTATDPVSVARRHQTITNGSQTVVNQTGALSLVLPSGATLGCASGEVVRIHVAAIRNAGSAMELVCWTAMVAASLDIRRFDPTELATTTAISAGSDSSQTLYSTTARTSQPMIYLGYIEATSGATAGQWASVDKIVNWEPGVPMPGDLIQALSTQTGVYATGTTLMIGDNTIPQNTEGDQYMTLSITPRSSRNLINVFFKGQFSNSVTSTGVTAALFKDSVANALSCGTLAFSAIDAHYTPVINHFLQAGTTSAIAFKIRAGGHAAGTTGFNGITSFGQQFGGVFNSFIEITEYHV